MTQVRHSIKTIIYQKKKVTKGVKQSSTGSRSEFSRCLDKIRVKILLDAHGFLCMCLGFPKRLCNALTSSFTKF